MKNLPGGKKLNNIKPAHFAQYKCHYKSYKQPTLPRAKIQ